MLLVSIRMILPNRLGSAFRVQFAGDVGDRDSAKPFLAVSGVVALARAVDTEEAGEAVYTELASQDGEGVLLKLLVGECLNRCHSKPVFRAQSNGFATSTVGRPARRNASLQNLSSVVSRMSAETYSAEAR